MLRAMDFIQGFNANYKFKFVMNIASFDVAPRAKC